MDIGVVLAYRVRRKSGIQFRIVEALQKGRSYCLKLNTVERFVLGKIAVVNQLEMIQHVSFEKTTFNELPFKFEAGTPDYIGTTGLAKALDYVNGIGMEKIAKHEHELTTYALQRLKEIPDMRIFGEAADRGAVISFLVGNIHHFDLGTLLDRLGIAVRTGHHCAQPLMQRLGIEGTVRASFAMYNTKAEIDALVAGIERVSRMF